MQQPNRPISGNPHQSVFPIFIRDGFDPESDSGALFKQTEILHFKLQLAPLYKVNKLFVQVIREKQVSATLSNHVFLDLPEETEPFFLENVLFDLQVQGYIPVLVGPERLSYYQTNLKRFDRLRRSGAVLLLDLLSVLDSRLPKAKNTAQKLLKQGMIDFVGARVTASEDVQLLAELLQSQRASEWFQKYPIDNVGLSGDHSTSGAGH